MSIDKITPLGESGSLESETTFDAWVDGGFVDERVRYTRLNRQFNRADTKINELRDYGPSVGAPDDTSSETYTAEVFTPDTSMMSPFDTSNVIDLGHTGKVLDQASAVISGKRKIVTLEFVSSTYYVRVYDVETQSLDTTYTATNWEAHLDTSGSQNWDPFSLCCDAEHIYMLFEETSPAPDEYWIQAYDLADFSKRDGWPTYGTELSVYQQSKEPGDVGYIKNATVSTDGKLVVKQSWRNVTSGASDGLAIIDKTDGSIDGTGTGDCGSVTSGQVLRIASNGEYVIAAISNGGNIELCSMSIATPGATGGFPSYSATVPTIADTYMGGLACCGNRIVVTFNDNSNLFSLYTINVGLTAHFQTNDLDIVGRLYGVCTDGHSFWARGQRNAEGYSAEMDDFVYRLDGARFGGYAINTEVFVETYTDGDRWVTGYRLQDVQGNETNDGTPEKSLITADGSGLWMPIDQTGENTILTRLHKSVLR